VRPSVKRKDIAVGVNFVERAAIPKRWVYLAFLCLSVAMGLASGLTQSLCRLWQIGSRSWEPRFRI
jgi:hypothetical protein